MITSSFHFLPSLYTHVNPLTCFLCCSSLSFSLCISCSLLGGLEAELCLFSFCLLREQEKSEMEQNETGCQAPQAPILCVNNCGFFGTAATMNMCSKCYKDLVLKQEQAKLAATSIQNIVNGGSTAGGKDSDVAVITEVHTTSLEILAVPTESSSSNSVSDRKEEVKGPKRCFTCRKRVGLTGFDCRCGNMFCAVHRYSDKHECPFDYRSAGQEAIAKANPIVKAEKLDKI